MSGHGIPRRRILFVMALGLFSACGSDDSGTPDVPDESGTVEDSARDDDAGDHDAEVGAMDDAGGRDGEAGVPGPDATCAELGDWFLAYAHANASCMGAAECVPALPIDGGSCLYCYFEEGSTWAATPALNATAVTPSFESLRTHYLDSCNSSGDDHWQCVADSAGASITTDCMAGSCSGTVQIDMRSCLVDAG